MSVGTPVLSATSGTVIRAGEQAGGYGYTVLVRTPRGDCARYQHLQANSIVVRVGQHVGIRDPLAKSGNTGNSSGPHLHYGREDCRSAYSIQSAFLDVGSPGIRSLVTAGSVTGDVPATPPASCPPVCRIYGASAGVNERKGPSFDAGVNRTIPNGSEIRIVCQTEGDAVGGSRIWDQLDDGGYVSDYYVNTPVTGGFSPGISRCGAPPTPPTNGGQTPPPPPPVAQPPGTPPPPPAPIVHYDCPAVPNAFGHYVPAGKHWGNDFVAQGRFITGGSLSLGANPDGGNHQAKIGIYTGGPLTLSGALGETVVNVSGYGGVAFSFNPPIAVTPGTSLWLAATGIGDFTAYDRNNNGVDGCFQGHLDGTS